MEEHATIVSLHEVGNIKHMYDKSSDFCRIHVYLHPPDPWEGEKTSLAYEGYKMKDNCEGDEFTPSFFVGDNKIIAMEGDVFNGDKAYFVSYPKEEYRSYLKSSFEFPNEVEDHPPPVGCELENLKKKNMMQRDAHSSDFCTLLQHDEVAATSEERFDINENPNPTIIIEDIYEPYILASAK